MKDLEKKSKKGLDALKAKQEYGALKRDVSGGIDDLLGVNTQEETPVVPMRVNRRWMSIAAAFLFLALASYFAFPKSESAHNLYSNHFDTYPDILSSTLRGDEVEKSQIMQAMEKYNSSDFKACIAAFEKMSESPGANSNLYLGISHLAIGNDDTALSLFDKVPENSDVQDGVIWYRALAYLKKNELDKAKSYLQTIASSKHYKSVEAKEILEEL